MANNRFAAASAIAIVCVLCTIRKSVYAAVQISNVSCNQVNSIIGNDY